jgi:hypothetical protein
MSRIGYVLIGAALLLVLGDAALQARGDAPSGTVLALFGLAMLAGLALLAVSAIRRLVRGEVKLRPVDAAKRSVVLFGIMMGLRFLLAAFLPDTMRDPVQVILYAACFAAVYSLYITAYRKPA